MAVALFAALCLLMPSIVLGDDICQPASGDQVVEPPNFRPEQYTVDLEITKPEQDKVIQARIVYSKFLNHMKMSVLDAGQKFDVFYIANEQPPKVVTVRYLNGRGQCTVTSFAQASQEEIFSVGNSRRDGLNSPLGFLKMIGDSGFDDNLSDQITLQKLPPATVRGISAQGWRSCQKWQKGTTGNSKNDGLTLQIDTYFSNDEGNWTFPKESGRVFPLQIVVHGAGVMDGETITDYRRFYNFFRYRPSIDPRELEIPVGVYCDGRSNYPFPKIPSQIQFMAEVVNRLPGGSTDIMEEIFDTRNQFAQMKMADKTIFREYRSGLSFTVYKYNGSCVVRNITEDQPLPFDYKAPGGLAKQLSAKSFFYDADIQYQYMGKRNVRGYDTISYVGRGPLLNYPNVNAVIEWYFAPHSTSSWNDNVADYRQNNLTMPVLWRAWPDDMSTDSIDVNFFQVDFARPQFGSVNIRTCFSDRPSSHIELILPGSAMSQVQKNLDEFKWRALWDIADSATIQWWRVADFKLFLNTDNVIIAFEILDVPPYASDVLNPPIYNSMILARQTLATKVQNKKFQIRVWNDQTLDFDTPVDTAIRAFSWS